MIKLHDVSAEYEVTDRSTVGSNDVAGLFNGIVFNSHLFPAVRLKKVWNVFWIVGDDVDEQVVCDADAFSSLAGMVVVDSQKVYTGVGMAYYVVPELDVFQRTPGRLSILISHSQNNSRGEYLAFDPIAAAVDGAQQEPGEYRNYKLRQIMDEPSSKLRSTKNERELVSLAR